MTTRKSSCCGVWRKTTRLIDSRRGSGWKAIICVAPRWRAGACLAVRAGVSVTAAAGWHSPVRVVLALVMLLFVPGEGVAVGIGVTDPVEELAVAVAVSISLGAIVSLTLLYLHSWTLGLSMGILVAVTVIGLARGLTRSYRRGRRA